jgi:hypothetical protein
VLRYGEGAHDFSRFFQWSDVESEKKRNGIGTLMFIIDTFFAAQKHLNNKDARPLSLLRYSLLSPAPAVYNWPERLTGAWALARTDARQGLAGRP